ncbi:MAG: LLM class flavin-dependent oxidoreductase [Anaerolineae bacterium]
MIDFGLRMPDFPTDGSSSQAFVAQMDDLLDAARGGFVSAWVADHFVPWANFQDPMTATYECWTTLTYLAGAHKDYLFGNIVLSQSYRPPALTAKMAATLQELSGGRLVLGLGAGWKKDEYLAYGYDFPPPAQRIHELAETVQIIRRMWTEPRTTFEGKYYQVRDAICEPKPAPLPPIMIGGGGKQLMLRLVARSADWWNFPGGSVEKYADLLATLRAHCADVGRDYDSIVKTWACDCVAVAPTTAEARRMADATPFCQPDGSVVGTPDEVAAHLRRFTDLGVTHFMLRFADFPRTDAVRLFAREVIPQFA